VKYDVYVTVNCVAIYSKVWKAF